MNKYKKLKLVERALRVADPKASKETIVARMYGILSAHITQEQVDYILELRGIDIKVAETK
jgi:hypothetical protein